MYVSLDFVSVPNSGLLSMGYFPFISAFNQEKALAVTFSVLLKHNLREGSFPALSPAAAAGPGDWIMRG